MNLPQAGMTGMDSGIAEKSVAVCAAVGVAAAAAEAVAVALAVAKTTVIAIMELCLGEIQLVVLFLIEEARK